MADFSQLQQLNVTSDLAEYTLHFADGTSAALQLAPALESNPKYFNALLRKASSAGRGVKMSKDPGQLSIQLKKNRADDRLVYAKHILKGWSGIKDSKGKDVKFTEENSIEFINALPDWVFDDVRNFASDVHNYIECPIDVEDKVKN